MMKRQIEEAVGKINGRFGEIGWTPVVYQYRNLPFSTLGALYTISDIGLVTPLRDGMNLVAKEYVAARASGTGVLILSEMAGAVKELGEAVVINPNDLGSVADAMHEAISMPPLEQSRRISIMQTRLKRYNVERWAEDFLSELGDMQMTQEKYLGKVLPDVHRKKLLEDYSRASNRLLLLDYDGTLIPFHDRPRMAVPTPEVIGILRGLASDPLNTVVIVSGRDRETLNDFFSTLPVILIAEHGAWMRDPKRSWQAPKMQDVKWKSTILPILELYTDRLPGALIEEKGSALAWHYRRADPEQRQILVGELMDHLTSYTASIDLQILQGNKVIEIRTAGVNKGTAVSRLLNKSTFDFILSIGDDWTDEDVFKILPDSAYSLKVGIKSTHAKYNLRDTTEVLELIGQLPRPTA
jgi:trehalose 6-phosphate synthase/phosphatase